MEKDAHESVATIETDNSAAPVTTAPAPAAPAAGSVAEPVNTEPVAEPVAESALESAVAETAGTESAGDAASAAPLAEGEDVDPAEVLEALKDVIDPELSINIVDLGLIYGITTEGRHLHLDMTLTSPACPLDEYIAAEIESATAGIVDSVDINWQWLPPWGPDRITDDGRDQLRAIGFNL
ncbi:Metal-sulfur cluster biosynthetic enzyme [Actinobaculum suis]|uniref:Metal-sulfur cluster assembly factor n=1 Tax=Actinobaculum suis TaxID=1657 RepID=A0A1G7EAQ9_9ACTO|nr:metal-sulfur cluster assembly factor [Actinobaculum suis]MDY5153033.1 metal-sulfur cluster assembly factor [Actinobaculum suis]SDE60690.1 Metal-sulfur cluster biosynthetic enzyme [Actinobaculum suis]VDG76545.1 N-6 adenine-specific DNA methylase [Actinobaculum suis]